MATIAELSDLSGRTALITGATGGLGSLFADTLAELGASLILVDRPDSDLATLASALRSRWGIDVDTYFCDFEIQVDRNRLLTTLNSSKEELNVLINNAAFVGNSNLSGWNVPFEEQSIETWRRALEVNLTSIFDLCQGLYPLLKKSRSASIINIASIYGMYGPDWSLYQGLSMSNPAAYSASKGGVIQLTRWLATTLAPGVRVNAISPGGIYRNQAKEFVLKYEARTPLRRMAKEEDFRGIACYLSSDLSEYVTGQIIEIDGGWGVW